jgi:hypothetical protein
MSTELATVQQELRLAKQEAEIMSLKFELQKVQAEKASRLEDSLLSAALFPHYKKVAETLASSEMVPRDYQGKPGNVLVAMEMGYQLGLPIAQSLQDIAVINNRPSLWGDGLLALAISHPECEYITEEPIYKENTVFGYECRVKRKGHPEHKKSFTLHNAKQAELLNKKGPWTQYPERMLQMRARVAIKDKFADALRGFKVVEIDEYDEATIIEGEVVNTEKPVTRTEQLKNILNTNGIDKEGVIIDSDGVIIEQETTKGDENIPASIVQIHQIETLMEEKKFDEDRIKKAFEHFKIEKLPDLTDAQARKFLFQLEKVKVEEKK